MAFVPSLDRARYGYGTMRQVQPSAAMCGANARGTLDSFSFPISLTREPRRLTNIRWNALSSTRWVKPLQLCRLIFVPFGDPFPIAFRRSRSTFSSVTQVEHVVFNALTKRSRLRRLSAPSAIHLAIVFRTSRSTLTPCYHKNFLPREILRQLLENSDL